MLMGALSHGSQSVYFLVERLALEKKNSILRWLFKIVNRSWSDSDCKDLHFLAIASLAEIRMWVARVWNCLGQVGIAKPNRRSDEVDIDANGMKEKKNLGPKVFKTGHSHLMWNRVLGRPQFPRHR